MKTNCPCSRIKYRYRQDKYGQCHQAYCGVCGLESTWHTSQERALIGFNQNKDYKKQPKISVDKFLYEK